MFYIQIINKINLIAVWSSPLEGNVLFIGEISKANSAELNEIRFFGGRHYSQKYC